MLTVAVYVGPDAGVWLDSFSRVPALPLIDPDA